jgi:hypothetical protein
VRHRVLKGLLWLAGGVNGQLRLCCVAVVFAPLELGTEIEACTRKAEPTDIWPGHSLPLFGR